MVVVVLLPRNVHAASTDGFKIQASPSPLVLTLAPGQSQTAELTIRNFGSHPETLAPILKTFTTSGDSKTITFNGVVSPDIASWVVFGQSRLTIAPGTEQKLQIQYHIPQDAGFSYSFAVILEREQKAAAVPGAAAFEASIAVFNLLNINRPDAHESLTIESFKPDKKQYEFLPISFSIKTHNAGNIIGKPTGNIFIQRSADDNNPVAVLPINPGSGYILPDKSRTFTTSWSSGFPRFVTVQTSENGNPALKLQWNWRELNQIRFGHYVAKAVVVYNDGKRDIPVTANYDFWVIPWRLIAILTLIGLILLSGIAAIGILMYRLIRKVRMRA
jgi:hypothetical protein